VDFLNRSIRTRHQQFREVFDDVHPYQLVIHDHDSIFSASLDAALSDFGVRILRTPVQASTANAYCERLVGTIRRECLDYLIPVNERHLHLTLREFAAYYNRARPHSALGPGTPEPILPGVATTNSRHQLPTGCSVRSKPVLGGLHHDYRLEREAA
jgi:putative transposase